MPAARSPNRAAIDSPRDAAKLPEGRTSVNWQNWGGFDAPRRLQAVRVQQVAEQFDPVDQAWAWARKRRCRVDGEDPLCAEGLDLIAMLRGLSQRVGDVVAAGH